MVDKTLLTFGDVVEWADLISFLTKLIKVASFCVFLFFAHLGDIQ